MSDITPIHHSRPTLAAGRTPANGHAAAPRPAQTSRGGDQVQFSLAAQLLSKLADVPDVRQGLIDRVSQEIADETYDTPDKWDKAIDGLMQDLG